MNFDHLDEGTPEAAWAELITDLDHLPPLGPDQRLLVVAAHPDDETLGAGGLIATSAANGCAVTVLVATDGDASHPQSPTHRPEQLAEIRRREVYAAIAELAPSAEVLLLGLPDGRLAQHESTLHTALDPLVANATHVVTPWSRDGHPDHEACGRVAADLAGSNGAVHWEYPIWAWHWDDPADPVLPAHQLRHLELAAKHFEAKSRALARHVSQHRRLSDQDGDEAILSPAMLAHFQRRSEVFVAGSATPTAYFADLYRREDDPWGLDGRFYEQRKRAALLAALTRPRFRRVFEPGCATGALTADLTQRCDEVVAWDVIDAAVERTRGRLAGVHGVHIDRGSIPNQWPDGTFDLIVLSEVGYYCPDLRALEKRVQESLSCDGVLVACHWRHPASIHVHSAGTVHAVLGRALHLVVSHVEDDFLLQVWTRSGRSVATAEGILP